MTSFKGNEDDHKLHEECGVFGIYAPNGEVDPAQACYNGILALQHRGQESCGIAINNDGVLSYVKDMGLVTDVFNQERLSKLKGQIGVGHVRYSKAADSVRENAQPLIMRYVKGAIAIVYNGVLTNAYELRRELQSKGSIFQTTTDPEIISYLIAQERVNSPSIEVAIQKVMDRLEGAYSMILLSPQKLIAVRDPYGLKPLCMGKIGDATVFSSESTGLDAVGADLERDVEPGEIIVVKQDSVKSLFASRKVPKATCIFEYIYFARDDSVIDGVSVYEARKESGRLLARQHPVDADLVIGVPESGIDAAIGYSEESGIPYEKGIVKNGYIGRTFIRPTQAERERGVKIKLNPLTSAVAGKRVVMLDDSIVRGTTSARIVKMLKDAGATEVHLRISSPPFIKACYYGSDIGSENELIAAKMSLEEICKKVGADSLGFLEVDSLKDMIHSDGTGFCDACFTGNYPSKIPDRLLNGEVDTYCQPLKRF
ncbi:MAG: amidophosphoribosyltransferase [Oscillospiraceae bacterium]|nr:amidophosphoribosyltransferase [Oscillospiraceae bacterium]